MSFAHSNNTHIHDSSFTDIGGNLNIHYGETNLYTSVYPSSLGDFAFHNLLFSAHVEKNSYLYYR